MRILALNWRCTRHPEAGGAEINLFEQARRWVRDGDSVTVVCARSGAGARLPHREQIDGVEVLRLGGRFSVYPLVALFLRRHAHRYDVILDVANGIPFFAPLFTRTRAVLLIHHVHGKQWGVEFPLPFALLGRALERWLVPFVYRNSTVIAVSETTRDALLREGFRADQIDLVHNGVYVPDPALAIDTAMRIVYVGRFKRYKRLDRLVRAFAGLLVEFPDARLVLCGDGDARRGVEALVRELGIERSVIVEGRVDEARKAELLSGATAFATPSMHEGWGMSVIEANAHGVPAVAYDVPGLRASIVHGRTGLLASDDREFREALGRLLRDAELRERLSQQAREWAERFDWDASARKSREILKEAS